MQSYLGENLDSLAAGLSGLMAPSSSSPYGDNNSSSATDGGSSSSSPPAEQRAAAAAAASSYGTARSKDRDLIFCSYNQDNT